jgi:hypothetical protein
MYHLELTPKFYELIPKVLRVCKVPAIHSHLCHTSLGREKQQIENIGDPSHSRKVIFKKKPGPWTMLK